MRILHLILLVSTWNILLASTDASAAVGSDMPSASISRCGICLEDFDIGARFHPLRSLKDNNAGEVITSCKHCFHGKCLEQWMAENKTCPYCRTNPLTLGNPFKLIHCVSINVLTIDKLITKLTPITMHQHAQHYLVETDGTTCLSFALNKLQTGHLITLINFFKGHSPGLINAKTHKKTPLARALRNNLQPAVFNALLNAGANPNAQSKNLGAPLHQICSEVLWTSSSLKKSLKLTRMLIAHGADPLIINTDGETPGEMLPPGCMMKELFDILEAAKAADAKRFDLTSIVDEYIMQADEPPIRKKRKR